MSAVIITERYSTEIVAEPPNGYCTHCGKGARWYVVDTLTRKRIGAYFDERHDAVVASIWMNQGYAHGLNEGKIK